MPQHAAYPDQPPRRAVWVSHAADLRRPRASRTVVHPHGCVVFVVRGSARIWCGSEYAVQPGDVLILPEGQPHRGRWSEEHEVWGLAVRTPGLGTPAERQLGALLDQVADGAAAVRRIPASLQGAMADRFASLGAELRAGDPWSDLAGDGHLAVLVAQLLRAGPGAAIAASPEHRLVSRALAYVNQHARGPIRLADVAAHVHRSPAHVSALVKARTGRTVLEWITLARLAEARALLARTDETVEAVAWRVGFASTSHFHRLFRRHHAVTPTQWRRQARETQAPIMSSR